MENNTALQDAYKALAIVDDTTKQDPMKTIEGFSSNFSKTSKDSLVVHESNITKYDKPVYASAEVGILLVTLLALFFLHK